jgi:hypothetical protein
MVEQSKRANAVMKLIGRAWANPEFREQLVADPKRYLVEAGVLTADDSRTVKVIEGPKGEPDTSSTVYFLLPPRPPSVELGELSEAQLHKLHPYGPGAGVSPTSCCCDITVAPRLFD